MGEWELSFGLWRIDKRWRSQNSSQIFGTSLYCQVQSQWSNCQGRDMKPILTPKFYFYPIKKQKLLCVQIVSSRPEHGEAATMEIHSTEAMCSTTTEAASLHSFPGPLSRLLIILYLQKVGPRKKILKQQLQAFIMFNSHLSKGDGSFR